ncbi:MAG: CHAP domain-containing protein [Chitinophagaceae bacterium]|nr:CHAP domain-containing protein [Chitinophagaceae bacterium]
MKHIDVAITQLGVEETPRGSNWSVDIKKYLASVGIPFPASWCAAFVYWCVRESLLADGAKPLLPKTGGVLNMWNKASKDTKFTTPEPGDVFIMDYGKGFGHTGFVESVDGETIHTIEGNTNDEGDREGYEVCRRKRKISSCIGFIRIT